MSNQSTIDEEGETLTKKQKVKHAASMHTFHGAASGRYIHEKNQSRVKNGTWGFKKKCKSAVAFQYQTIHLACYQSYQSQLIQY